MRRIRLFYECQAELRKLSVSKSVKVQHSGNLAIQPRNQAAVYIIQHLYLRFDVQHQHDLQLCPAHRLRSSFAEDMFPQHNARFLPVSGRQGLHASTIACSFDGQDVSAANSDPAYSRGDKPMVFMGERYGAVFVG